MPDITITVTVNQAQRIAAAFGPQPEGSNLTQQQWVIQNTKAFWKEKVKQAEQIAATNAAFDAAAVQVSTDFPGF
jgi:hypothetical protein